MEPLPARTGPLYWLLVAVLLPAFNWWLGLWVVVWARDAVPLLVLMPLLLAAEGLGVSRLLRSNTMRIRPFGTAGLLLVTTFAWSFALTLVVFALQENAFTF